MARKRKKLRHLNYNSKEYWNRLLAAEKMSMSQGRNPKLIYDGDSYDLDRLQIGLQWQRTGRVMPKPQAP